MVRLKAEESAGADDFIEDHGLDLRREYRVPEQMNLPGRMMLLDLPEGRSVEQALAELAQDRRVATAAPNHIFKVDLPEPEAKPEPVPHQSEQPRKLTPRRSSLFCSVPAEPNDLGQLWGMKESNAPGAWRVSTGSRQGPIVAVIDTGVDYRHRDLVANIWTNPGEIPDDGIDNDGNGVIDDIHGFNAIDGSGDPMDDHGHGTHVAGTIGAIGNNALGVVGMNWDAQIMPIKFLGKNGLGDADTSLQALLYANQMGARIINNSWGVGVSNPLVQEAIEASPCLQVCASGNSGADLDQQPTFPAGYASDHLISVASHDDKFQLAFDSNYGAQSVDLAAPGVDIHSTFLDGEYITNSGTSMACPHVTGTAALIATEYPQATNAEIKQRLLAGSQPLDGDLSSKVASGGRLDAGAALENDQTAPGPLGLSGRLAGKNTMELNWTATGDDGVQGQAANYDLRYSTEPLTESDFSTALALKTDRPGAAGEKQALTVELRPSGRDRRVRLALRAVDNVGLHSPTEQVEVLVPGQPVAFEDSIDDNSAWEAEHNWGLVEEPGRGAVYTDSPAGHYQAGERSALTSQPFSLKGFKNAKLDLDLKHALGWGDEVTVEVRGRGWFFKRWRQLESLEGHSDWARHTYDLSKYDGQDDLRIRVRLKSNGAANYDGVWVDDVVVSGEPDS